MLKRLLEYILNSVDIQHPWIATISFTCSFYTASAWQGVKETAAKEELKQLTGLIKHEVKSRIMTANGNSEKTPEGYRRIRGVHRGEISVCEFGPCARVFDIFHVVLVFNVCWSCIMLL
jgi:hypothetical protein